LPSGFRLWPAARIFSARRQTEQAATRTPASEKGTEITDTTTDTPDTSAGEHHPVGTLEHIDPQVLVVDTNVRDEADVDADFQASIKEHSVLIPIAAVRDADGQLRVRSGQRRTIAAREAGLATVPVYVRTATAGDERAEVAERVSEQIVENDQRRSLTDAQRARGIQQMLHAGLSVSRVAKIHRTNAATAARGNSLLIAPLSPLTRRLLASVVFVGGGGTRGRPNASWPVTALRLRRMQLGRAKLSVSTAWWSLGERLLIRHAPEQCRSRGPAVESRASQRF
jgi:hypothetical protein